MSQAVLVDAMTEEIEGLCQAFANLFVDVTFVPVSNNRPNLWDNATAKTRSSQHKKAHQESYLYVCQYLFRLGVAFPCFPHRKLKGFTKCICSTLTGSRRRRPIQSQGLRILHRARYSTPVVRSFYITSAAPTIAPMAPMAPTATRFPLSDVPLDTLDTPVAAEMPGFVIVEEFGHISE